MSRHASRGPAERHPIEKSAFRLRRWPEVPERFRTAPVLRAFSRMSVGPVTGTWFLGQTGLPIEDAVQLLAELEQQDAIDAIPFDIHPQPPAPASPGPRGRIVSAGWRLAFRQALVAMLACLALAAPGDDQAATFDAADLMTSIGC